MLASADSVQTESMCICVSARACVFVHACVCVYLEQEGWQMQHWGKCMPQILMTGTTRPTPWRQVQPSKIALLNACNFFFIKHTALQMCSINTIHLLKQDITTGTANSVDLKKKKDMAIFL